MLGRLPDALRAHQKVFDRTGGLHAAGLFTADGRAAGVREDVGRHNAVDKVVGWAAREGRLPLTELVLMVSGRASFELTQKATMAGIPVAGRGLGAVQPGGRAGRGGGLTLVGFLRPPRMTVYAGAARLGLVADSNAHGAAPSTGTGSDQGDTSPVEDGGR